MGQQIEKSSLLNAVWELLCSFNVSTSEAALHIQFGKKSFTFFQFLNRALSPNLSVWVWSISNNKMTLSTQKA